MAIQEYICYECECQTYKPSNCRTCDELNDEAKHPHNHIELNHNKCAMHCACCRKFFPMNAMVTRHIIHEHNMWVSGQY
jgi:hypothetical protein